MSGFTLATNVEHWLEVKQSRFLAQAFPIADIDHAMGLHLLFQHYQAEKLSEDFNEQGLQLHFRIPAQYLPALTTKINLISVKAQP